MKIAILGLGKVGRTLLDTIRQNPDFHQRFQVDALWNRSFEVFEQITIPAGAKIYRDLDDLFQNLDAVDLVVECAHPILLHHSALKILSHTNLFVSSPSAFADADFRQKVIKTLAVAKRRCYIPLGASVGIWDVIRLDQNGRLKNLKVEMRKHPSSFKINDLQIRERLEKAMSSPTAVPIARSNIAEINKIAPQNTNTMAIYALAASGLGFSNCQGRLVADQSLAAHIVQCDLETSDGLKISLQRDNPAGRGAVTGSATFSSFLNSLYHYSEGVFHNHFTFC